MGACAATSTPHEPAAKSRPCGGQLPLQPQAASAIPEAQPESGHRDGMQVIPMHKGSMWDHYATDSKVLGEGTYGIVHRGTHIGTGEVRAIKTVRHHGIKSIKALHMEIAIMKALDHPHVVKLFEASKDHQFTYLAMELCEGGELLDAIIAAKHFSENQAAQVMQQILRAVLYVHSKDIAHRDLKPQNFLLQRKGPLEGNTLKLIDFGFATSCKPGAWLKTRAGTALYVAPQVLMGRYDKQCDLWSLGVTLYALLSGRPPFNGQTDTEIFAKIRRGRVYLEASSWRRVSTDAKDLIRQLLKMSPSDRLTAQQALEHPWIVQRVPEVRKVRLGSGLVERLHDFCARNKLERAVLKVVARQLSDDRVQDLRAAFESLDANGDGRLTLEELRSGLDSAGLSHDGVDLRCILASVDTDGSGEIDYSEFLAATLDRRHVLTDEALRAAFQVFDRNADGGISKKELASVLCSGDKDPCECHKSVLDLLRAVDLSGDGLIDFCEFRSMMRSWEGTSLHSEAGVLATAASPASAALGGA
mmetsp:Transcript_46142/g.128368  ORF Transcript_46142/g.128368 Transcript_46142/m.128368 type:complete len:531 (-) Transcript_46142:164-1756(-)|eukprot:CAMPEP_0179082556 /NCGR_PEP_ID=MMETSP0796-20121207/37230_1 /TAXON_ID=73915 /ORGANISM="Pyrodinium bahamense, Strain pbaha01" /LENGTH=530 /DNA_ID=CAMNT_0020779949 /DNA_START=127 /DNA_END=1719 /DNA_ORIENTATION=-